MKVVGIYCVAHTHLTAPQIGTRSGESRNGMETGKVREWNSQAQSKQS